MEDDEIKGNIVDAFDEIDPLGDEDPRVEERGEDEDVEAVMSLNGLLWGTEDENNY